ncbi:hypothetical protein LDENG_00132700 [Lucifuga dentata]|nr:hypothetical protein LDENG_00132700 [Lucifuga dentata]
MQALANPTHNTTRPSTLGPSVNSQGLPPEKVILIQENMTWIEAMGYCRMHHEDLVYITTKEIQEVVAEKAKNASSSRLVGPTLHL